MSHRRKTVRRRYSFAACSLIAAALANVASAASAADPAARPIDPAYVTPDTSIALVAHPRLVLTQPNLELLPTEVFTAASVKQFGIDPVDVDEVVVILANVLSPEKLAGQGPKADIGIVLHLRKPVTAADLEKTLLAGTTAAKLDGSDIRQAPSEMMPSFFVSADGKTIVVSPTPMLKRMLAVKTPGGPMASLLKQFDSNTQVGVVQSMDLMRADLNALVAKTPAMPPAFENLKKLPDLLAATKFTVSLQDKLSWKLMFAARDGKSAEETEQTLAAALQFGKLLASAQVTQQLSQMKSDDPVQQALLRYSQRMLDESFAQLKPVRQAQVVSVGSQVLNSSATGGMMLALLLPAISSARAAARNVQGMNNLRQLTIAMLNDESTAGNFPARAIFDAKGKPLLSWRVHILPYLEQDALYKQFHLDEPWDSEHNKPLIEQMPLIFAKPGRDSSDHKTVYLAPVGKGTMFDGDKGTRFADLKDGSSRTILLVEADDDKAVIWTKPDDLEVDFAKPLNGLGHASPRGFGAAFADGSIHNISATIDPQVLKALFTVAGGEPIDLGELEK